MKDFIRGLFSRRLTELESQILRLILSEYSNSEIAFMLKMTEREVEAQRRSIYRKTQTRTLVGLVKYGIKNKL